MANDGNLEAARVERVRAALAALGHDARILDTGESTHTAEMAAAAAGCKLGQIVKTLVTYVSGTPMFVLVPGDRRLDDRLLATRFGVGRKQVKLADAAQVLELTGYPVGGVSPFGTPARLPTLIDSSFDRFDVLWVAAGTASTILRIHRDTWCGAHTWGSSDVPSSVAWALGPRNRRLVTMSGTSRVRGIRATLPRWSSSAARLHPR